MVPSVGCPSNRQYRRRPTPLTKLPRLSAWFPEETKVEPKLFGDTFDICGGDRGTRDTELQRGGASDLAKVAARREIYVERQRVSRNTHNTIVISKRPAGAAAPVVGDVILGANDIGAAGPWERNGCHRRKRTEER